MIHPQQPPAVPGAFAPAGDPSYRGPLGPSAPSALTPAPSAPIPPTAGPDIEPRDPRFRQFDLPVSTTNELPGMRIHAVVGVVFGVVSRPRDLAHHPEMAFVNTSVRQDAVAAMVAQAVEAGADGVVGLSFDGGQVSETVSEVTAYGTAVILAR